MVSKWRPWSSFWKLLVGYPNSMASVDDLKLEMVIPAKSGQDWSERTRLLAARMPDLSIFTMGLVELRLIRLVRHSEMPSGIGQHGKPLSCGREHCLTMQMLWSASVLAFFADSHRRRRIRVGEQGQDRRGGAVHVLDCLDFARG